MTVRRADDNSYTLLSNGSATGATVNIKGGEYILFVDGTIGASTAALQALSPTGVWMTVQVFNASLVQATALPYCQTSIDLPAGQIRLTLTGGTPTGINAYLQGLG